MQNNNGDEIEYFGFLPITFTTDLQESLEEALHDIFHGSAAFSQKIESHIIDTFKKNLFIFNNFVLRNILKFPATFRLERRITDKLIKANTRLLVGRLQEKQRRMSELIQELKQRESMLKSAIDRRNAYENLLRNKCRYDDLIYGAKELKSFLKETMSLYESYQIHGSKKSGDFDKLMEYKNIKNEYYRSERERLFGMGALDTLEYINKHMQ